MTASERDRLPYFILSPVFSPKRGKSLELFNLLRKEVEKYERDEPYIQTEEEVYQILSSNEWNQKTFDSMESRLLNVIKKSIIYQYVGIDKFGQNVTEEEERLIEIKQLFFLSKFYRERKLSQQYENTINRLKSLQSMSSHSKDDYYNRYLLAVDEYEVATVYRSFDRREKRSAIHESLDLFYIINKLTLLLHSEPPIKEEIEEQLQCLENLNISKSPIFYAIISLYRKAFQLMWFKEGDDEIIFQSYLDALESDLHLLPIAEQKDLYTAARNFCTIQYKKGKVHYLGILFKLIKKNLKAGFFYHKDGEISDGMLHSAVQNIVAIALKLQESDWVFDFLNEHRTKIIAPNVAERERFYHFSMACYCFQRQEYDEALSLLKIDFDDERYRLMSRALEIKLYYEKHDKTDKEVEFLENRITALEIYLTRSNASDLDKAGYRNFIKIIRRLLGEKRISSQSLTVKNSIAEREWVLEKVEIRNERKKRKPRL